MRILIVEDEKDLAESLKNGLEEECFMVDVVHDGRRGSYVAQANDYDLIILDYYLPFKNGLEVCEDIRKKNKSTPIIIISVCATTDNKISLFQSGVDDYLTKPFAYRELLERVKALLRRPKNIQEEKNNLNGLIIDLKNKLAFYNEKEIYLTRKEFMVLRYLVINRGQIVSRNVLLENIWDVGIDPFSNTLESHILNIRRKLFEACGNKFIQTLSGRGYRIK